MTHTLIVSLVLAAVSGLTFIAYKHPGGYKNIATPMIMLGLMITLVLVTYNISSLWWGVGILSEELAKRPDQSLKDTQFTIERMAKSRDSVEKILVVALPSLLYLIFLWHLPKVLGVNKGKGREDAEQETGGDK